MADVTTVPSCALHDIFKSTLENIADAVPEYEEEVIVDIEMVFKSLYVEKSGVPFFSQKQKQDSMEFKLATRIRVKGKQKPDTG
jgi:hypothetical protein